MRRYDFPDDNDDDNESDDSDSLLRQTERKGEEVKPWNVFKIFHRKTEVGSTVEDKLIDRGVIFLKLFTIFAVFLLVLGSAVVSKGTLLFMTSQIKKNITRPYCNNKLDRNRQYVVSLPESERAAWIWLLVFSYFVPELGTFMRSMRICIFKTWSLPQFYDFLSLLITETFPAIGSAILVFIVLPELDVIKGAMLTNAVCLVPAVVFLLRNFRRHISLNVIADIWAISAQASALVVWPMIESKKELWAIPISIVLISVGWWENFIPKKSAITSLERMAEEKREFPNSKYFSYAIISVWKCLIFFTTTLAMIYIKDGSVRFLFADFSKVFMPRSLTIVEIQPIITTQSQYAEAVSTGTMVPTETAVWTQMAVWLINIAATYICYACAKFSSKIMIQGLSFAFPICLSVPVLLTGLVAMCGFYTKDECAYADTIPPYLFFNTPPLTYLRDFVGHQHAWLWLLWLLSQVWITQHIWVSKNKILATTEKLFMRPMFDAFLIDQSLALNRRIIVEESVKESQKGNETVTEVDEDKTTRIYACGTMWHETKEEMVTFLKSIMRMDEDQCAQRLVRNYLGIIRDEFYEWETHIFFDDAFVRKSKDDNDPLINEYVQDLIKTVPEAASAVHQTTVKIRPPVIYPTPYGGRLVWTLPGKTKMIAHLKDKAKIRAKKRWSQVMYMYYLLGHRIMDNDQNWSKDRTDEISKNTYILALDGDIDFQPQAVQLLVQYMRKNELLGAACGRIHPIGGGAISWYQVFEYAVGHWMQKATEHVIGCVLCSPGCFSLFRADALMEHNVMARYTTTPTEALHYIQYDQGEDRWLCTLLLQRGFRVEYSAASDAYTHCPEGFNEFYNQRRRWMPSTMANIMDLLQDSKHIVKINDNISSWYIVYQVILMVGTIIGPGTIFLMLIGAFVTAFKLTQWVSFVWNITPIAIFVLCCIFCKSDTQLSVAAIISGVYGLVMMAVLVGIVMQINEDGFMAPSSLFFFVMASEFVIAAIIHPKEFYCLKYGLVYYVTVPSMYMLLVIYSIFNMNNISWGTRDVTVVAKPNEAQIAAQEKKKKQSLIVQWMTKAKEFFKFENDDLKWIQASLQQIQTKLDYIERVTINPDAAVPRKTTISKRKTTFVEGSRASAMGAARPSRMDRMSKTQSALNRPSTVIMEELIDFTPVEQQNEMSDSDQESFDSPSDDLQPNNWLYDEALLRSNVTYLDKKEETFWRELLDQYLLPIEDDKEKLEVELKNLRDKMVMSFFMINALFVLTTFLLTLQKDIIHIPWPLNPKVNFTYIVESNRNTLMVTKTYLSLEPIGFVFLIFFFSLMFIQFIGMIFHRWATYAQIMANTDLSIDFFETMTDKITEDELIEKDPIKTMKKLIKLKGVNGDDSKNDELKPVAARRSTVAQLAMSKQQKVAKVNDLDKAFQIRMAKIRRNEDMDIPVPRKTLAAIERRRTTFLRRKSQLPPVNNFNFDPQKYNIDHFNEIEMDEINRKPSELERPPQLLKQKSVVFEYDDDNSALTTC